ncbi:MAG: histidine kinase [Oscillospiraceae bacterium]|nr:histidine kinase [Oscillospiraceae bacterium]
MAATKPETTFYICKTVGFGLLLALWSRHGETEGFFLFLFLLVMSLLRWRFSRLGATVLLDCAVSMWAFMVMPYMQYALVLVMFEGLYRRFYWVALAGLLSIYYAGIGRLELNFLLTLALGGLCGVLLGKWEKEVSQKQTIRDEEAGKYYELESVQSDMLETLPKIERMTVVSERARIAREIHDNAGHEIVAAYISLQTARGLLDGADSDALELYDAAMERLNNGVKKVRETAHNLQTVTSLGVETLLETCDKFPACPVNFRTFGDTSQVPVYVWSMLEACLNECLTNAARHARPSYVTVELDVTEHMVRLCIENDGAAGSLGSMGNGQRNLRRRAMAIGGSLSVESDKVFRVVCVIPVKDSGNIKEEENESTHS